MPRVTGRPFASARSQVEQAAALAQQCVDVAQGLQHPAFLPSAQGIVFYVTITDDRGAVAIWLPPGGTENTPEQVAELLRRLVIQINLAGLIPFPFRLQAAGQVADRPVTLDAAGLEAIPASLYEAAILDGASAWRRFTDITLPPL